MSPALINGSESLSVRDDFETNCKVTASIKVSEKKTHLHKYREI